MGSLLLSRLRRASPNSFTRFTGFTYTKRPGYLVYGLCDDQRKPGNRYIEEGDVSALTAAALLLESVFARGALRVVNARSALPAFSSFEYMLSVSGPIWNPVTSALMTRSGFDVTFSTAESGGPEDVLLFAKDEDYVEVATRYVDGIPRECHAVVISVRSRIPKSFHLQRAVLVAGISTLGTFGGVSWLSDLARQSWGETGLLQYAEDMDWCAVIRVRDDSPKGFFSYASNVDSPSFLTTECVHSYAQSNTTQGGKHQSERRVVDWFERVLASLQGG